jgi:hypothetical protein
MGLESDSLSDPITVNTTFRPINGGGVFGFFNPTPLTIIALDFQTALKSGLDPATLVGVFFCNDANTPIHPNPFFTNCALDYNPTNGSLVISFFGVDDDGGIQTLSKASSKDCEEDDPIFERLGILPLLADCAQTPDAPGCTGQGHFVVTLNDGFVTTGTSGGWSVAASPFFFSQDPVFRVMRIAYGDGTVELADIPEPSIAVIMSLGVACLILLRVRGRRRSRA